jgi:hypothetical protein
MLRCSASPLVLSLAFCALAAPSQATIRTVTNTDDSGAGSLRSAIAAATSGDTIQFAIPGGGFHTISPQTPLPSVAGGVTIDGITQPGASCVAWPPVPKVEIEGGSTSNGTAGLTIAGASAVIRGLVINSFPGDGIHLLAGANGAAIECNFIGTDAGGTLDYGNGGVGVALVGVSNTLILGNLISANAVAGVSIDATSQTNGLSSNYIGTDVSGAVALGNFDGVLVDGASNTIGGGGVGNVISGNTESGVVIDGAAATANLLYANEIGSNAAGNASLPNGGPGVFVSNGASQNTIGGIAAGAGNVLRANGAAGVYLSGATSIGNAVRGNSILLNGSIGIEIGDHFFENPNDPGDPDSGANRLQNTPELVDVTFVGNQVTATYSVSTDPVNATYPLLIDFYRADADSEEGETYLGSTVYATTDFATGVVSQLFTSLAPLADGNDVVATATDSAGNTSEFTAIAITVVPEPGALACGLTAFALLATRRRRR